MPKLIFWGIKMSSENNCLDNIDQDQVKQREGRSLNGFAAETALSQLAYALDQGGTIGEQKFFRESLPLLITSILGNKGGRRSKGIVLTISPAALLSTAMMCGGVRRAPCFE